LVVSGYASARSKPIIAMQTWEFFCILQIDFCLFRVWRCVLFFRLFSGKFLVGNYSLKLIISPENEIVSSGVFVNHFYCVLVPSLYAKNKNITDDMNSAAKFWLLIIKDFFAYQIAFLFIYFDWICCRVI